MAFSHLAMCLLPAIPFIKTPQLEFDWTPEPTPIATSCEKHIAGISAFGSTSDIIENRSFINSRSAIEASFQSNVERNVVYSNDLHGIHVERFSGDIEHNLVYSTGFASINVQGPGLDAQLINNTVYESCSINPAEQVGPATIETGWDWFFEFIPPDPPPPGPPFIPPGPIPMQVWGNIGVQFGDPLGEIDGESFDLGSGGGAKAKTAQPVPEGQPWTVPFDFTEFMLSSAMFEPIAELGHLEIHLSPNMPASGQMVVTNEAGFLSGSVQMDLFLEFRLPNADIVLMSELPLHIVRSFGPSAGFGEFDLLQIPLELGVSVEIPPQPLVNIANGDLWQWDPFLFEISDTGEPTDPQHKGDTCAEFGVIIQDESEDVRLRNNVIYVEGFADPDSPVPTSTDIVVSDDSRTGMG